jgi:anaerobic dimethyl sulfoxide reductase subunit B (iron-sulfur subunit)
MMGEQYGFFFDADRCVMCHACEVACKANNSLEPGVNWRKVIEIWQGEYPHVSRTFVSLSCLHCAKPSCLPACSTGAISKRETDGIVVVNRDLCNGCRECYTACPYGIPQFGADGIMQKCDFCLGKGMEPACTTPCPADALFFGSMDDLARMAGEKKGERLAGSSVPSMYIHHRPGTKIPPDRLTLNLR